MANRIRYRVLLFSLVVVALLSSVQLLAVAQNTPHLVVNTSRLNVRSGPGVSHNIIDTVAGGTVLPVISLRVGSDWIQVTSPVGPGWVNSTYTMLMARGDFTGVPNQFTPPNLGQRNSYSRGCAPCRSEYSLSKRQDWTRHWAFYFDDRARRYRAGRNGNPIWRRLVPSRDFGRHGLDQLEPIQLNVAISPVFRIPASRQIPVRSPRFRQGAPYLVVNTAYLNVRTGPGVGHDILTTGPRRY